MKQILEKIKFRHIIVLILGTPLLVSIMIKMSNPLLNDKDISNDWIGFYGSFTGAILGGIITLIVMEHTIKSAESNTERSINESKNLQKRNEKITFCNDIAGLISKYCFEVRGRRYECINMHRNREEMLNAYSELLKLEELDSTCQTNKGYSLLGHKDLARIRYEEKKNEFYKSMEGVNNGQTIYTYFELGIKLKSVKCTEKILNKIAKVEDLSGLYVSDEDDKIIKKASDSFEKAVNELLEEVTIFIEGYLQ